MVYGNVHEGTEANLQDTERRAAALHGQVVGLSATRDNLTRELNLTVRAKDSIMQMLLGARRDLEGINASFRQCQADQEREDLAKGLEERKRQVEQMQMQVEVKRSALDTCLKAKSQPLSPPRMGLAPPNQPTPIDSTSLEEFKKRILEGHQLSVLRPAKVWARRASGTCQAWLGTEDTQCMSQPVAEEATRDGGEDPGPPRFILLALRLPAPQPLMATSHPPR
ncbi:Plasmalemma vesicle-associated protein [Fukomys damarensis]|uniref:Plasmalemma vesicle-associated protein n=1 Tax=Fukomys damarensis TaxID=885580 RepID=A0A091DPJ5_FUKDA|nr:Plasmalemma vesicle-associated protein [Fukomys damarensis]